VSVENTDKNSKAESRLNEITKQMLDQSIDEIDAATLSRLRQARHAAINQNRERKPVMLFRPALMSAFSVTALALMLVYLNANQAPSMPPRLANEDSAQQMDDFNLLANGADLDLVNDLEFYEWLEHQQNEPGGMG